MSQQISLKIFLSNHKQFRKFSINESASFTDFLVQFKKITGAKAMENEEVVCAFKIDYLDEANDWIYLSGFEDSDFSEKDLEWKEAIKTGKKLGILNLRVSLTTQETTAGKQKRLEAQRKKRQAEEEQKRQYLQEQQKKREEYLSKRQQLIQEQQKKKEDYLKRIHEEKNKCHLENMEERYQSFYAPFDGFFGLLPVKNQNKAQSNECLKKEIPSDEVPASEEAKEKESSITANTMQPAISPKPLEEEKIVGPEDSKQVDDDMPTIETIPEQTSSESSNPQLLQENKLSEMDTLKTMGFINEKLNAHLLKQFNNDISKVVNSLLKLQNM